MNSKFKKREMNKRNKILKIKPKNWTNRKKLFKDYKKS